MWSGREHSRFETPSGEFLRDKKEHLFYFPYSFLCFTYSYELNSKEAQSCAGNKEAMGDLHFR